MLHGVVACVLLNQNEGTGNLLYQITLLNLLNDLLLTLSLVLFDYEHNQRQNEEVRYDCEDEAPQNLVLPSKHLVVG